MSFIPQKKDPAMEHIYKFYKKHSIGHGTLLKFKNDPNEYALKNIGTDHKTLFCTIDGRDTWAKPVSKIIKVNRKDVDFKAPLAEASAAKTINVQDVIYKQNSKILQEGIDGELVFLSHVMDEDLEVIKKTVNPQIERVPLHKIKPSQSGESYKNPSSEAEAEIYRKVLSGELNVTDVRKGDFYPILVNRLTNKIIDGNHRHYALSAIKAPYVVCLFVSVPREYLNETELGTKDDMEYANDIMLRPYEKVLDQAEKDWGFDSDLYEKLVDLFLRKNFKQSELIGILKDFDVFNQYKHLLTLNENIVKGDKVNIVKGHFKGTSGRVTTVKPDGKFDIHSSTENSMVWDVAQSELQKVEDRPIAKRVRALSEGLQPNELQPDQEYKVLQHSPGSHKGVGVSAKYLGFKPGAGYGFKNLESTTGNVFFVSNFEYVTIEPKGMAENKKNILSKVLFEAELILEAKIDDFYQMYVVDKKTVKPKEFEELKAIDAPPYTFMPYFIKRYKEGITIKLLGQFAQAFNFVKNSLPNKDINAYTTKGDMQIIINKATMLGLNKEMEKFPNADKIASSAGVDIFWIKTMAAAQKYGRGTKWCISATSSRNAFQGYDSDNFFYFLIDKNKPESDSQHKIAIQVDLNPKYKKRTAAEIKKGIPEEVERYNLKYTYWDATDEPIRYQMLPELQAALKQQLNKAAITQSIEKKAEVQQQTHKVAQQLTRASNKDQQLTNPLQYLERGENLPVAAQDLEMVDLRHEKIISLKNLKACGQLLASNNSELQSLGDLHTVRELADFRNCPNITQFSKLKSVAEAYVNVNTNQALKAYLQTLTSNIIEM